jgi:tetratricopeptide (TPR) repeat protein
MRNRITLNPYDGDAYYQLGLACFTLQLYDEAENSFRQAQRFLPGNALAHYFTGLATLHASEREILAIAGFRLHQIQIEFERALQINPNLKQAHSYLELIEGLRARDLGDYAAAIDPLKQATNELPGLALAWKVLAACFFQIGQYEDAIHAAQHTLELHPTDEESAYLLGAAHFRLGHEAQMERFAHKVAELRGDSARWEAIAREYRGHFE